MNAQNAKWFFDYIINMTNVFGPIGLVIAMVLQAIIVIIPSELVMLVAGGSLGVKQAVIWGTIGELAGGICAFLIASKLGRPIVKKIIPLKELKIFDDLTNKFGGKAVLVGRLLPFVPFDAVSYASGLTAISFSSFFIATAIGAVPRAFFFSYLGDLTAKKLATEGVAKAFYFLMSICAGLAVAFFLGKHAFEKHVKRN